MSEIEKQFFEVFEIEPKYYCGSEYIFEAMLENECTDGDLEKCKTCEKVGRIYPPITDRILLELICIANHEDVYIELEGTDVETMKNNLLENFIHFKRIIPKQQVQALFKENN